MTKEQETFMEFVYSIIEQTTNVNYAVDDEAFDRLLKKRSTEVTKFYRWFSER